MYTICMLSKTAFFFSVSLYSALAYIGGILLWQRPDESMLWLILTLGTLSIVLLGFFVFTYKSWSTIADGYTKLSPFWVSILLLVPGLNVLWLFQSVGMYSVRCNQYIARHDVPTKRLPVLLFFLFPLLVIASFIPLAWLGTIPVAIGVSLIIIWTSIEANNAIVHHQSAEKAQGNNYYR